MDEVGGQHTSMRMRFTPTTSGLATATRRCEAGEVEYFAPTAVGAESALDKPANLTPLAEGQSEISSNPNHGAPDKPALMVGDAAEASVSARKADFDGGGRPKVGVVRHLERGRIAGRRQARNMLPHVRVHQHRCGDIECLTLVLYIHQEHVGPAEQLVKVRHRDRARTQKVPHCGLRPERRRRIMASLSSWNVRARLMVDDIPEVLRKKGSTPDREVGDNDLDLGGGVAVTILSRRWSVHTGNRERPANNQI